LPNLNYRKGAAFERRFLIDLLDGKIAWRSTQLKAIKAQRFTASKGICDVWWLDEFGKHHEAQLKYATKAKPYISPGELDTLKGFAKEMDGKIVVWLVKKQFRKPIEMELLN